MKKQLLIVLSLSALSFASVALAIANGKEIKKADAYSISTLPTTIDLNDTSEANIRSYYSSLNSLSASEKQGNNLLKNLKTILRNNQKYYSYDNDYGRKIWQIYEIADRDWERSPAQYTSYGTYNSSENKIYNYQYGTSNSNTKNNPYIHALYVNRNSSTIPQAWGDHNGNENGINREHIWAKSHGMGDDDDSETSGGARGDPMHLWPSNPYVNGFDYHGNLFYGFVDPTSSTYSDAGWTYSHLSGNQVGSALNLNSGSTKVFEPQDCDKGDIARAIFYMAARYNYLSGSDTDDIDANNPNLVLVDDYRDSNGTGTYDSTTYNPGQMGILRDLLAWNRLDPPDEWEIHRNNLLYTNYTNNRNPFIDYPEWAEYIWGKPTLAGDNRTITAYSTSPTGSANPSTDNVGCFTPAAVVSLESISVNPTSKTLEVGETQQLSISYTPSDATNKKVSYSSNNTGVATVNDSGLVTAVSAGNATITVTSQDGGHTATCAITVNAPVVPDEYSLSPNSPYINELAYKMYFYSSSTKNNHYFTGSMDGYYGATSTNVNDGVDVFFEPNGQGQNIYFKVGNTKYYFSVTTSGSYVNFKYDTSVPSLPWYYKTSGSAYSCMTYQASDTALCTFGRYSTYTNFGAVNLNQYTNNYEVEFVSSNSSCADAFAKIFLDNILCDEKGDNAPTFKNSLSWTSFEKIHKNFNQTSKTTMANTDGVENGSRLECTLAKYDYIITKYGPSKYSDYLGRINSGKIVRSRITLGMLLANNPWIIVVTISSISLLAAFGVLMLVRKRRKYR